MAKRSKKPKSVLKLPDLDYSKSAVLNSLPSLNSRRSYEHAIRNFIEWYCSEPRLAFNKMVVTRYRIALEQRRYAPSTINLRLAAVRRLAYEASDCGLLSPDLAAGIRRVKGAKRLGVRVGNWLTVEQGKKLLAVHSGNFVFNSKGTRFYIFTVAWTYNPRPLSESLSRLRFQLIKDGHLRTDVMDDLSGFHACDDPAPRRNAFIQQIVTQKDWNFASMVIEKNRVNPTLYAPGEFYGKFLKMVLNFVLRGRVRPGTNKVLVYTDTLPMKNRRESSAINSTVKASCNSELHGIPFQVLHHTSDSNYWIQVADYCSWAVNRKWEHGNDDFYKIVKARLAATEIAPMGRGDGKVYYR